MTNAFTLQLLKMPQNEFLRALVVSIGIGHWQFLLEVHVNLTIQISIINMAQRIQDKFDRALVHKSQNKMEM
jgi:hypothetical protein